MAFFQPTERGAAFMWKLAVLVDDRFCQGGVFDTITDAARRIREMEGRDIDFLNIAVELDSEEGHQPGCERFLYEGTTKYAIYRDLSGS
jgi:hypothetical protein